MKSFLKKITISILTWEAKRALKTYNPKIIAVTGSVGKTSTKDAIYAVVSSAFDARRSEKSMNSEIGLPLAILGLDNAWNSSKGWLKNIWKGWRVSSGNKAFPRWLVLEVGADHPGDIEKVGKWIHPDIVVLTRMSDVPVHVEFFKDTEEVLTEKMYLAHALKPDGTLVINADDSYFMKASHNLDVKKITYGQSKYADIKISETGTAYGNAPLSLPRGQYAVIDIKGNKERVELDGVVGNHTVYPVAAASAVASILNIADDLPVVFSHLETPKGRMRVLSGISKSSIIDDTYNSSPIANIEALNTLKSLHSKGRKIAVLADMKELGTHSERAHIDVGTLAGDIVHTLVVVGKDAEYIAKGALDVGLSRDRIYSFETSTEAAVKIPEIIRAGDIVLVKGSQSMRMERVAEALLEDKSKAHNLLVRQEEEWKRR